MVKQLHTVDDAIEALGGTNKAARRLGRSPQAVSNWRADGAIPPKLFIRMQEELGDGFAVSPELFGMSSSSHRSNGRAA